MATGMRLDETPQLLNILTGCLSFVGPWPLLPIDQPAAPTIRLRVSPRSHRLGANQWWSTCWRGRKRALDELHVQNASFWLDIRIMLRAIGIVLSATDSEARGN